MLKIVTFFVLLSAPLQWIYVVDRNKCNGCGNCLYACSEGAITMVGGDAWIDPDLCTGCGDCVYYCPRNAIYREWYTGIEEGDINSGILTLSPNPASSGQVKVAGVIPGSDVVLLDLTGRRISTAESDSQGAANLNITSVQAGTYVVVSGDDAVVLTIVGSI